MSASFEIESSSGSYSVRVESHGFAGFLEAMGESLILADAFFTPQQMAGNHPVIFAEASEALKSLDHAPQLIEQVRIAGASRGTHLVAVGGGIVQDISAFIASIYMRGLQWSYLPTTVLAMVDSCIGGKSSINVGNYKNLVGTFHPPTRVLIDPALAATLPSHEKASGLIEAAKICFCRGQQTFSRYLSCNPGLEMSVESLEQVVSTSLLAKKWFIEIDEFDKKERLLLNFGHTFGHAMEGASHYRISHGIAVGLGILCALEFERQRGLWYDRLVEVTQLEAHLHTLIATAPCLPEHMRALDVDELMQRFESDKKHSHSEYTLILVSESGAVGLQRFPRTPENQARVRRAFAHIIERYAC